MKKITLMVLASAFAVGIAFAQTPPAGTAPATQQPAGGPLMIGPGTPAAQTAAPPPPAPVPVGPPMASARDSLSSHDRELMELQQNLEKEKASLALLTTQNETQELSKKRAGNVSQTSELPQLVGLVTCGKKVCAEFLSNDAILNVAPGEWVSAAWRLKSTMSNAVELESRSGNKRHTLFFGGGSATSSSVYRQAPKL